MSRQLDFEHDVERWDKDKTISENVRDINLQKIDEKTLSYTQDLVYKAITAHPNGICDKKIQQYIKQEYNEYLPISSINGRRNDLIKKKLVTPVGTKYIPDHNGRTRLNTLWGIYQI